MKTSSLNRVALAVLAIFLGAPLVQAQEQTNPSTLQSTSAVSLRAGAIITTEAGYDTLVHAVVGMDYGLYLPKTLDVAFEAGFGWLSPSTWSDYWYRYRGFFFLNAGAGPSYSFLFRGLDLRLSLIAGGALARYSLSDSYFFFPYTELRADIRTFRLASGSTVAFGLALPVQFRADATSLGIEARVLFSWHAKRKAGEA